MTDRTAEWNALVGSLPLEQAVQTRLKEAGPPPVEKIAQVQDYFAKADARLRAFLATEPK